MHYHDHVVERQESSSAATGLLVGLVIAVLIVGVIALFVMLGGPGRITGQPQPQQQRPAIEFPSRIDININPGQQQPAQQPAQQQPAQVQPAQQQPAQQQEQPAAPGR